MQRALTVLSFLLLPVAAVTLHGQPLASLADSIRMHYRIPEIGYAVISSDSIIEIGTIGIKRYGTSIAADAGDRFHLGSNTKGVTGLIAALLVKQGAIRWDTGLFDLCPELKRRSNRAYHRVTLLDLLTHRAGIPRMFIGDRFPSPATVHGSARDRRAQFCSLLLGRKPAAPVGTPSFSNGGFIVAAVMLERASGRSWEQLVADLGGRLGIGPGFFYPNDSDTLQPWGHTSDLVPAAPADHYKEGLLSAAGNVNMNVVDYARFIQEHLRGLRGRSSLLTQPEFEFVHYGRERFSVGWEWYREANGRLISHHTGSAGTFCSQAYILPASDRAYILLTNSAPEAGLDAMDALRKIMMQRYGG
ncbi:MAG: beta-lactamase family protein [Bacteroidetes bacterium]|nr:beta-lactamase family protein [Bacteroidota bacterium]